MALALAVVALDGADSLGLVLRLGAVLGRVTQLIAVVALGHSAVNNLTSILEALHVLLGGLGPKVALAGASGLRAGAIGDRVLLVHVALEVHVGHGGGNIRLLNGNEPDVELLLAESLLKLAVSSTRGGLDVDLDSLLDVIELALDGSFDNELPSSFDSHVGQMTAINLAGRGALSSAVTGHATVLASLGNRALLDHVPLLTTATALHGRTVRALLAHVSLLVAAAAHHVGSVAGIGAVGFVVSGREQELD